MRHTCFIFLIAWISFNHQASGQQISYPVSSIDTALLRNALIVVRKNEMVININSLTSETITRHTVTTLLKSGASAKATCVAHYNEWTDIDRFEGCIYDAKGLLVKKLGKKEIVDESAIGDGSLYSDERVKIIRPVITEYPVTVEYFIKQTIRRLLFYPTWQPLNEYHESVESAQLEIHAEKGLFPRVKTLRMPANTVISGDGEQSRIWSTAKLASITDEPLSSSLTSVTPVIFVEPNTYAAKKYTGDFGSWKSFGYWIASMQESRDSLNQAMHDKVNNLVSGAPSREEKIRRIYHFMQSTCRYLSVNTGIGGIQSEKAEKVARLGYGDCKGLVNYTAALLKAASIASFYTLVRSGEDAEPILRDFPGNQFDHVILCVPEEQDTIWLECTSMKMPFGFLGSFTDDRDVLMVTPDGGRLTHTPVYRKEQNRTSRKTTVTVDSTGDATAQIHALYGGLQFESEKELPYLSANDQKESLRRNYNVPGVLYSDVTFAVHGEKNPVMEEQVTAGIPKFASLC